MYPWIHENGLATGKIARHTDVRQTQDYKKSVKISPGSFTAYQVSLSVAEQQLLTPRLLLYPSQTCLSPT